MGKQRAKRGRRHASSGLEVAEWLDGQTVYVDDQEIALEGLLKVHDDRSFSMVGSTVRDRQRVVVRAFDRQFKAEVELLSTLPSLSPRRGLVSYSSAGQIRVQHPRLRAFRGPLDVYVLVRPYRRYTLSSILEESNAKGGGQAILSATAVLGDLAAGLNAIHQAGIVHGDLRPHNVLLDERLNAGLADFGFSELTDVDAARGFAAPEVLSGLTAPSSQSDVYSFGKLGRLLLDVTNPELTPSERQRIGFAIAECLHPDPDARLTSASLAELLANADVSEDRVKFSKLGLAALADIDARLPEAQSSALAVHDIATIADDLEDASRGAAQYRLRALDAPAAIHFLATLTIVSTAESRPVVAQSNRPVTGLPAALLASNVELDAGWRQAIENRHRPLEPREAAELRGAFAHLPPLDLERLLRAGAAGNDEARESAMLSALSIRSDLVQQSEWLVSEEVTAVMSPGCPDITTDEVRILRDLGYLLSVPYGSQEIYPTFQFAFGSGLPFRAIKDVNDALRVADSSPWGILAWWLSPNERIDGRRPSERLAQTRRSESVTLALSSLPTAS